MYDCPICNAKEQFSEIGSYENCRVCGWEDDDIQVKYPDEPGINKYSLSQARIMWANGETLYARCPNPNKNLRIFRKKALPAMG